VFRKKQPVTDPETNTLPETGSSVKKAEKTKLPLRSYIPLPALILYIFAAISAVIHIVSRNSTAFSDFFNRYICAYVRGFLAYLTGWTPFSLAEVIIVTLPITGVILIVKCVRLSAKKPVKGWRFVASLFGVTTLLYSMFVWSFGVAYSGSTLEAKLGLERRGVTREELYETSAILLENTQALLDEVKFEEESSSVMPYGMGELNKRLNDAYWSLADRYEFIPHLRSRFKFILLSEPMTYTHISGMYTYYTGEANLNVNFPDYTLPFTAAHELSHQRGIAREDEANFMAFLVCAESDDPYIRYSGFQNLFEYVTNALYSADSEAYRELVYSADRRILYEMIAYNEFYDKYRDNLAAEVSSAVNDTYLKAQGQTDGAKSYGRVVDLAVAYILGGDLTRKRV